MKFLFFLAVLTISQHATAKDFRITAIDSSNKLSFRTEPRQILLYKSDRDADLANALIQKDSWIPSPIRAQIDYERNFIVAATKFTIDRNPDTISANTLLDRDALTRVCSCTILEESFRSSDQVDFSSSMTRQGFTMESSNHIRVFPPSDFDRLPVGRRFLETEFGLTFNTPVVTSYQISYNFSRFFEYSMVVSFYAAKGNDQVEVVSLILTGFAKNTSGIVRRIVKGQFDDDILRIARVAENN